MRDLRPIATSVHATGDGSFYVDSGRRWATVDCRIFTASPLAPYAAKTKTASERGEVPTRGSKHLHYLIVIIYLYDQE
jgi:hypothetical protein